MEISASALRADFGGVFGAAHAVSAFRLRTDVALHAQRNQRCGCARAHSTERLSAGRVRLQLQLSLGDNFNIPGVTD